MSGYLWIYAIFGAANLVYFTVDGWWGSLVGLSVCVFGFVKTLGASR